MAIKEEHYDQTKIEKFLEELPMVASMPDVPPENINDKDNNAFVFMNSVHPCYSLLSIKYGDRVLEMCVVDPDYILESSAGFSIIDTKDYAQNRVPCW